MATRWYKNHIEFLCASCDNTLKGVAYKDNIYYATKVKVEPCQRCLQCAEIEIEELKKRIELMYINGVTRHVA